MSDVDNHGRSGNTVHAITGTHFFHKGARHKKEFSYTPGALVELVETHHKERKESLQWIKLARFGDLATAQGSLRHNANVLAITGVEADYDGEKIPFDDAVEKLEAAGLEAILYTSPSHKEDKPRWRVLAPCSKEYPPDNRERLLARLNGIFAGALGAESFTLSQSYYFGYVGNGAQAPASHQAKYIAGEFIDLRDDLDAGAIGKSGTARKAENGGYGPGLDFPAAVAEIASGGDFHVPMRRIIASMIARGAGELIVRDMAMGLFNAAVRAREDLRGREKEIPKIIAWVREQEEGKQKPPAAPPPPPPQGSPPRDWLKLCIKGGKKGAPLNNAENIWIALCHDAGLKDAVRFNEMTRTTTVHHAIGDPAKIITPHEIADHDYCAIQRHLQRSGLKTVGWDPVAREVEEYARKNSYHPVRNWLESLEWDRTERLTRWLAHTVGAEASEYLAAIGQMFLVAMVARIFEPGCKADYMLILEGEQGEEKSKMCRILGGEWFSDHLPDITSGKDASIHLRGKWLIEIAEMHAFNKAESTQLKTFISRETEKFRPPYGRADVNEPRQNLFIGTTNKEIYLKDETGGRRFWPVKVKTRAIQLDWLADNRNQLFAEAVHAYREGCPWWPDRDFEREHIQPHQDARFDADAWEEPIAEFIRTKTDVTILEIAVGALDYGRPKIPTPAGYGSYGGDGAGNPTDHLGSGGTPVNRLGRADQNRIAAILTNLGWERAPRDQHRKPWRRREPSL